MVMMYLSYIYSKTTTLKKIWWLTIVIALWINIWIKKQSMIHTNKQILING